MPFPFQHVCELLDACHRLSRDKKKGHQAVNDWFTRHRSQIDAHDTNIAALLSALLPETRTDRVYCIQAPRLEKIIGRALMLGSSRIVELAAYKSPGLDLDLADCVERILTATPNPTKNAQLQTSVEEIDDILHGLASRIKWSSPAIRQSQTAFTSHDRGRLEAFYRQLSPKEAKWFTRLILKDYRPIVFDPQQIYRCCDPLLSAVMKVQEDFSAALNIVQTARTRMLPNMGRAASSKQQILSIIKPELGIKVGRQPWLKARSIKHCMDIGNGRMSVESKIDGEYCQIHIDPSKGNGAVQIFSKSGKDSTEDRQGVVSVILESLRMGRPDCQIHKACILEGELVVYSDHEQKVLPFHKIRKYVTRRGRFLGTDKDSQTKPYEKLMIIYYDILLLDDVSLLNARHSERFKCLERVVRCRLGRAKLVQRQVIDLNQRLAASDLRRLFAKTIISRGEGLVLKPDGPYFDFDETRHARHGYCIKLKKEYIGNFGDVGDFAVVGGGFDSAKARAYAVSNLKWTHFFIACLENREDVKRWDAKPEFTIVNIVELSESLMKTFLTFCNTMPVDPEDNTALKLNIPPGLGAGVPLTNVFTNPPVFDMRCFSFDKQGNTGFWSLRFPTVTKIHFDRDFTDAVAFDELQTMAIDSTTAPQLESSQEDLQWIARLEAADPRTMAVDALSQLTASTIPTPSPQKSTQRSSEHPEIMSPTLTSLGLETRDAAMITVAEQQHNQDCAPLPLITPPTLSDPTAQVLRNSSGHDLECSSPVTPRSCSTRKRRKSSQAPTNTTSSPTHKAPKAKRRRTLEDIDGNSSQPSTVSFSSKTSERHGGTNGLVIDLTSPDASFTVAGIPRTDPVEQENMPAHLENAINGETTTLSGEARSEAVPSSAPTKAISTEPQSLDNPGPSRDKCSYAGINCQLAQCQVIVPSRLLTNTNEIVSILRSHGAEATFTGIRSWMKKETDNCSSGSQTALASRTILLIDSIEHKSESRALMREIDRHRSGIMSQERAWVDVYDWRILDDLTLFEDESVTSKYFGGFTDPWRRWYCGLV